MSGYHHARTTARRFLADEELPADMPELADYHGFRRAALNALAAGEVAEAGVFATLASGAAIDKAWRRLASPPPRGGDEWGAGGVRE